MRFQRRSVCSNFLSILLPVARALYAFALAVELKPSSACWAWRRDSRPAVLFSGIPHRTLPAGSDACLNARRRPAEAAAWLFSERGSFQ